MVNGVVMTIMTKMNYIGCPYGSRRGNTQKELALLNDNQRKFVIKLFKENDDVLGIEV